MDEKIETEIKVENVEIALDPKEENITRRFVEYEADRIPDPAELRVAAKTSAAQLAGSIFAKFREYGYVKLRCIGDGALASGWRGYTVATGRLSQVDVDVVAKGAFFTVVLLNGQERDGMWINIEPR